MEHGERRIVGLEFRPRVKSINLCVSNIFQRCDFALHLEYLPVWYSICIYIYTYSIHIRTGTSNMLILFDNSFKLLYNFHLWFAVRDFLETLRWSWLEARGCQREQAESGTCDCSWSGHAAAMVASLQWLNSNDFQGSTPKMCALQRPNCSAADARHGPVSPCHHTLQYFFLWSLKFR